MFYTVVWLKHTHDGIATKYVSCLLTNRSCLNKSTSVGFMTRTNIGRLFIVGMILTAVSELFVGNSDLDFHCVGLVGAHGHGLTPFFPGVWHGFTNNKALRCRHHRYPC